MHQFKETEETIDDLMALPEDTKAELIDGKIYFMAPAAATHSSICGALQVDIGGYCKPKKYKTPQSPDQWRIIPEAWTYYDDHNSFVHDIAAFSWTDLPELPEKGPIKVKPTWVCEVLSPSNWAHDTQDKRVALEKYEVPYYWLVEPRAKNILVFELKPDFEHYQLIYSAGVSDGLVKLPPFGDLELDLAEIFA